MRWNRRQLALAALAAGCAQGASAADIIIHGGAIYTGVAAASRVEAVRIRAGRFVFAGVLADARSGVPAREINLQGAAAFPGFNDAHVHLPQVGLAAMMLDLVGVASLADLQQRLRDYARAHPEGPIVGRGWIETHWPERRFPTRADLEAIVRDRPVYLERIDGHAAVANSAALALGGIDSATRDPDGGSIERDASGAATGMLIDNAMTLVQSRLPAPTAAMKRDALAEAARLYASRGWTGVANMSTSGEEAMLFLDSAAHGALPLNADLYLTPEDSETVFVRGPFGMGRARVRGVKLYVDGALGSRGAALLAPYSDADTSGLLVMPPEEIARFARRARERGVQLATHAIGDRGNRLVLDVYRDAFAGDPSALRAARWRIEHAQVIDPTDIPRFAQMGVIASMQPSHAISDLHFAPARLGDQRLAGAYAWNALLRSGAVIAGGSDAPVEKGDPLIEFYAACHRHDLNGFAGPNWRLQERVSRAEALAMLTIGPAFAAFSEAERGTIEVGKRADLSCFSADLMTCEPADIPRARPVLTMCEGEVTHEAL
ncbi:MAG: amidohydrolase [Hyphomonadaceae bacterium]|nr:amidohydrolase [Hyphomonadaceae bacterium]